MYDVEDHSSCVPPDIIPWSYHRGEKITVSRLPGWQSFVQWHLIFVGPQRETCIISSFWCVEFWSGF